MPRRGGNEEIGESMREEEKRLIAFTAPFLSVLYHPRGAEGPEPQRESSPTAPAVTPGADDDWKEKYLFKLLSLVTFFTVIVARVSSLGIHVLEEE